MANMKEAQMAKEELLDNIQKFVLCGRAMLDAMEQIAIQSAVFKVQSADEMPAETTPVKQPEPVNTEEPKTATMEEVRGLLAEKSRNGFRAEVKALLTAHGVEKLSEITDPAELGKLKAEAGTNGYHSENSRAYLRVTTLSKADFYARVKTNEAGQPVSVELCFGGNDGINAILRVLDFAKQVLSDQLSGENT